MAKRHTKGDADGFPPHPGHRHDDCAHYGHEHPHPHPPIPGIFGVLKDTIELLHAVMRSQERMYFNLFSDMELPPGQGFILRILCDHTSLNQTQLAGILHVERAAMTTMLQRMEKTGLVVRQRDKTDQRVVKVNVTPAGREYAERVERRMAEMAQRIYSVWTPEECEYMKLRLQALYKAQETLIQEMQGVKKTDA